MQVRTWTDRITDESNLWLKAIQTEEAGNILEAFRLYLKDTSESLKQGVLVRAVLSCSCAADCLVRLGHLGAAQQLYFETALIYEKNANLLIGQSIRETIWSLQEAYEYFLLASDTYKAQQTFEKLLSLVRRTNPFLREEELVQALSSRSKSSPSRRDATLDYDQIASVTREVEDFKTSREEITNQKATPEGVTHAMKSGETSVERNQVGQ